MTNEQKKKALFDYVGKCRTEKAADMSCQWKGGKGERRFCRATDQKSCVGCNFYTVGIWEFFGRCYDIIAARDKEITRLQQENEDLRNGINFPRR